MKKIIKNDKLYFVFVNLMFIFSDWSLKSFGINISISDLFAIVISFLLILRSFLFEKPNQIKLIKNNIFLLGVLVFLIIHLIAQIVFNKDFIFINGLKSSLKLLVYSFVMSRFYILFKSSDSKDALFKIIEKTAVIVSVIGIYIGGMIYLSKFLDFDTNMFEFFWVFTRSDSKSYFLRGTSIVRLRSIFAEPSYFGTYINTILILFYFNKKKVWFRLKYTRILLLVSSFLTFALSVIPVTLIIELLYFIKKIKYKGPYKNPLKNFTLDKYLLIIISFLLVIFLFRDPINESIIKRVSLILSGGDGSARVRLFEAWQHVKSPIIGIGIGNAPAIVNNFAYVVTEFGIPILLIYFIFIIVISNYNWYVIVTFSLIHFAKGGYLSSFHFMSILFIICFYSEYNRGLIKERK